MKLKMLLAVVFVAGVAASIALAQPPAGHDNGNGNGGNANGHASDNGNGNGKGKGKDPVSTSTPVSTTTESGKVLICHKTGNGKYVVVSVSVHSAHARGKHAGDVPYNGSCPGPIQGHRGNSTTTTTASTSTSTSTTTTTTQAAPTTTT
jgi:hypothetical protein